MTFPQMMASSTNSYAAPGFLYCRRLSDILLQQKRFLSCKGSSPYKSVCVGVSLSVALPSFCLKEGIAQFRPKHCFPAAQTIAAGGTHRSVRAREDGGGKSLTSCKLSLLLLSEETKLKCVTLFTGHST